MTNRHRCQVLLLADLLRFLREDQSLEEPEEIARAMFPKEFPAATLREFERVGRTEAFSALLQFWLIRSGIKPPKGVFACDMTRIKTVGRPREKLAVQVYEVFHGMSKPTFGKVAREVFRAEFEKDPKKAADRARQLYRSYEKYVRGRSEDPTGE